MMIDIILRIVFVLLVAAFIFFIGFCIGFLYSYKEDLKVDDWEPDQRCFFDDKR